MNDDSHAGHRARWQRRERRRVSERKRIKKHAAGLARVYRDAVLKRQLTKQSTVKRRTV